MATKPESTVLSFKASLTLDGIVDPNDPKIRSIVEGLVSQGFKFEGNDVYVSHDRGEWRDVTRVKLEAG